MAEKDISEKLLEDYNDVFADIVNVLLFDGEEVIKPDELEQTSGLSQYKADAGRLHQQERDISKFWTRGGLRLALCGLENQTAPDSAMPLRVLNYDGASYRSQLLKKPKAMSTLKAPDLPEKDPTSEQTVPQSSARYPVVTLVLYFGDKRWTAPLHLRDALSIPEPLIPFVNDYRVHLYEIAFLDDDILKKFKSDFGIVADFFVQKRKNKRYRPKDTRRFTHVDAMLKFLAVMTGDSRYEVKVPPEQKGNLNMCEVLDRVEAEGVRKGIRKGILLGRQEGLREGALQALRKAVHTMTAAGFSDRQIMTALQLTETQLEELRQEPPR